METNAIKHPLPMKLADGNRHIYPTTIDMVFAEDGSTPIFDKQSGDWTANNALNLGGQTPDYYAKQEKVDQISQQMGSYLPKTGTASDASKLGGQLPSYYATAELASQLSDQKANKSGWTAGKNVVTDANGNISTENKPTIPSALPNPNALTINGQTYDGSAPVIMTVGGAQIDDSAPSTEKVFSSQKTQNEVNQLSQQKADKTGWTANKFLGTDENGNMVEKDTPESGAGTVKTVNDKEPDKAGNVKLDASDVGALQVNGTAADASKLGGVLASEYAKLTDIPEDNGGDANTLGGKEPKYYLQPRNLLDNSDFTNPVNQRGVTTHTGNGYSIDRWRAYHSDTIHRVTNEGVIVSSNSGVNPNMYQPLENGVIKENQIYTAACCDANGNVYIWSGIPSRDTGGNIVVVYNNSSSNSGVFLFRISVSASGPQNTPLVWAALYEGEYTIDNLPPYIPKGYTSELLECQRYAFAPGSLFRLCPSQVTPNLMDFSITIPVLMRDVPSFTPSTLTLYGMNNDINMTAITGVSYNIGEVGYAGIVLRATKNNHGFSRGLLDFEGTVFSADL